MTTMRTLNVISDIFMYTVNLVKFLKIIKKINIIMLMTMTIIYIDRKDWKYA
jgi:hypothetical protein